MPNHPLRSKKPVLFILLFSGSVLLIFLLMQPLEIRYGGKLISMLFPDGSIAIKERDLLLIIQGVMLLVVIPVYILTFAFSWFYRAHNPKGKYTPDLQDHVSAEIIWWGLPFIIVCVIGGLTIWRTYHLDPFRPIPSEKKEQIIQVVALQWKWLFIYPEQHIATVNYVQFPEKTPIRFEITADAPMNSFWIPALGSQIYAMPKMKSVLYLIADHPGSFAGCSANISGTGFSGMRFIAKASSDQEFEQWVQEAKQSSRSLDREIYDKLAKPSENNPAEIYQLKDEDLFNQVIMKFMHPQKESM
jgi:cytochrome o ubiquinol oxidase subunit 2